MGPPLPIVLVMIDPVACHPTHGADHAAAASVQLAAWDDGPPGRQADITLLRKLHPGLMDFQTWLERFGAAKFAALPQGTAAS